MSVIKSKDINFNDINFSNPKPYSSGKGNSVRFIIKINLFLYKHQDYYHYMV